MEEYIKLLELPEEFDLADLKKAYRQKVLKYHPDKANNEAERIGYEALMRKLNEANEYLKEYLEIHGGRYTKFTQDDTYSNNTEEDTQEESYEESYEEPQEEAQYDEDNEDEEAESEGESYEDETPLNTELIYESPAINSNDYKLVFNGKLYLYSDRLIFESNANVMGKYTKVIPFDEIKEIKKITKLKHVLEIIDTENNINIFVIDRRYLWLDKIYKFIDENNVPLLEIEENAEFAPENPFPGLDLLDTGFLDEVVNTAMFTIKMALKPMLLLKALKYVLYIRKFKHSLEEVHKGLVKLVLLVLAIFIILINFDSKDTNIVQQEMPQQEEVTEENPKESKEDVTENSNNKEALNHYMKNLFNKINTKWATYDIRDSIFDDGETVYRTVVKFTIYKDGRLIGEPEMTKSSGIESLDKTALETVKETAPFEPIPKEINEDSLVLEFTFETKKSTSH